MIVLMLLTFFIGIIVLGIAIFLYMRSSTFQYIRSATVTASNCASDECKLTVQYSAADGKDMQADIYTDNIGRRKEIPVRVSSTDSSWVVIDYPILYNTFVIAIIGLIGFMMCTAGMTSFIMLGTPSNSLISTPPQ